MMEINQSDTHYIHGKGDGIQMGFYIDRDHISIGKSHKLGEGYSADLDLEGDKLMSARKGKYIITKANEKLIEGTFHFTAGTFQSDETKK